MRPIEAMARSGTGVLAAVAVLGLFWGLNWPAVKFMLGEMPPLTIRAVALTAAALLLRPVVCSAGGSLRPAPGELGPLVLAGLLTVFGFNVLVTFGQLLTETSRATIIAYTMPALTALFAAPILGERLAPRHWVALALGMGGIAVLASEDLAGLIERPLGPLVVFGSALSWALGNVITKARTWSMGPMALAVWFLGVSAAACWPLVLIFEPPWQQSWPSAAVIGVMAWHVVGPMVTCYALWTLLVGRLPASVAAIATLLAPAVGVASSMWLLGDPVTWQKLTALAMVLGSIAVAFVIVPARARPG